ncbi:2-succinyl-5-enolpyruvyl-6-hydroxy-3-cyclohexene-1-carboxylic-acid synthase [Jannaschia sp. R86511]|uniref:2-succinyl-5-enolpyruvyl-6-hydroxy-3- cyclohexene-1-carboxylic-acid synthase n=1 Tax=Jannaschia sp. R86511 TaxID=3093853 RepID=UPI0036D2B5A8
MSDNPSTTAARAIVQGLVDHGVEHVVLCPGSRSAPLAYALNAAEAAGLLSVHVRIDERSAAFLALGLGKGGSLAAVVTTSGTAVANLLPAVWEARHGLVPLMVLTADRPGRLRGTWANQTTPLQAGAFTDAALLSLDLQADDPAVDWADVVARLVARCSGRDEGGRLDGATGPVHLDVGLPDPLVPDGTDWTPLLPAGDPADGADDDLDEVVAEAEAILVEAVDEGGAATDPDGPEEVEDPADDVDELDLTYLPERPGGQLLMWSRRRTVVVAGDGEGYEARLLADPSAFPLLAEPGSDVGPSSTAVTAYRHLLDLPGLGADVERVVVYGRPTLTRPVTRLLARPDVEVVHVALPGQGGPDREHRRVAAVMARMALAADLEWLERWLLAGRRARQAVDVVLDSWGGLSGLHVARAVARAQQDLPVDGPNLFVAASSVVRDLDLVMDHARPQPLVHASRGLSGIDGSLSTAAGIALSRSTPVRALVGDLAFLHDGNGLLVGPGEERPPVQVVVANDGGGGIFGLLEHGEARFADVHERFFATPQDVDLAALCRAHHVPHVLVTGEAELDQALHDWDGSPQVVEVTTDRSRSRALAEAVTQAARAAAFG